MKDWTKIRRINQARAAKKKAAEQAKPQWEKDWDAYEMARAYGDRVLPAQNGINQWR